MTPTFASAGSGSSSDTRQIQRALNRAGGSILAPLAEDGVMGPKTRARVIEFQRSKGLKPDGIVGPQTRAALGVAGAPAVAPPAPGGAPINSNAVVTTVVSATKASFTAWKFAAMFSSIRIFGAIATGAPGCLTGPNLIPLINGRIGALRNDDQALAQAAAVGIGTNFAAYQNGVTVPGLPWYPAFAAVPGPVAPPQPNLPSPLIALTSAGFAGITTPTLLQNAMEQAAGPALVAKAGSIFGDIAIATAQFFLQSISTTFVARVLGTGPVPTFAPPFVPVGPVSDGRVISTPGHLA